MPKININELSGIYKKIAELCDIGDKKGILVETGRINEVSIFNKAKKEYDETGNFSINGIKYKTNNGIITLATSNTGSLNNPDNKYPNLVPNFSIDLDKYYSNTIPKDNTNVRNEAVEAQKAYYEYNAQLGNSLANAA